MPEWFSIFVLICGMSIFLASLLYGREVMKLRAYNRFAEKLHERARNARELPDEEQAAEFRAISQAFRDYGHHALKQSRAEDSTRLGRRVL